MAYRGRFAPRVRAQAQAAPTLRRTPASAKPSAGFRRYVNAERAISPVPRTLAEIEDVLRVNATRATAAADAAGIPKTRGRFGTRAHVEFENLNKELNAIVKRAGSGFEVRVEEFRTATGVVVPRRAGGSVGVDVVVYNEGVPVAGYDLKTGRPWSAAELAAVQARFGVPITQIHTGH